MRTGEGDAPGYDEVLSRAHNPLALREVAGPPACATCACCSCTSTACRRSRPSAVPDLQRRASLAMEADPADSRGLLMASAFIVVAGRVP